MPPFSAATVRDFLFPPQAQSISRPARTSEIESRVILLFDRFRDPLCRYVISLGLPIEDGEEITQDVFLALFRHLKAGKSRENLPGWIFSVAHNLALRRRTSNQRFKFQSDLNKEPTWSQMDPAPSPEALLLSAQRQQTLLRVVEALPEQDQCCLRLRAEGLRYREIARVMGISLGSVSITLARSLARLMRVDKR
jgi:RNA polymerase sigma-70 factor, ECF subfamily